MKLLCAGLVPFAAWLAVLAAAPVCGQGSKFTGTFGTARKEMYGLRECPGEGFRKPRTVEAASQAFVKAFETGDVQAVAALFTEGAEYIDEGVRARAWTSRVCQGVRILVGQSANSSKPNQRRTLTEPRLGWPGRYIHGHFQWYAPTATRFMCTLRKLEGTNG